MAKALRQALSGLRKLVKAPWEVTGVAAGEEFRESMTYAGSYRVHAPGTNPKRAIIPHAEPQHVYDIKYYTRDARRAVVHKRVEKLTPGSAAQALTASDGLPPTIGKPWQNRRHGQITELLDYPNNGYTS
eukprot:jgi/Chlat1/498/Chrsp103S01097